MAGVQAVSACLSAQVRPAVRAQSIAGRRVAVAAKTAPNVRRRIERSVLCMAATEEAKMRAAEARWKNQVQDGKVKNVSTKTAGQLMKDGWVLLDVRPDVEVEKAAVEGAKVVPIFNVDRDKSIGTLLKKASAFGMGGWWLGGTHMVPNPSFLSDVQAAIPKGSKIIVACQKGLRSLAAADQLARAGYEDIAWINGGFDTAAKGDLPVTNNPQGDMRYAGIGGLAELLGWTTVQQDNGGAGFLGGSNNIIRGAVLVLVLDGVVFAYNQVQELLHK